jgi:hypothetical protein
VSAKSCRRLLAALVIGLAGIVLPAFHEKTKELMETMNRVKTVANIPAASETAEDVLAKYARGQKKQTRKKKRP